MKVLIYPKDSNPYQKLLYRDVPQDFELTYLTDIFPTNFINVIYLPFQVLCFRLCGYKVLHLHWVYTFRMRSKKKLFNSIFFKFLMTFYFYVLLISLKLLRIKLVWTVHDLIPHGDYFVNNKKAMEHLSKFADRKIIHSKQTINSMNELSFDVNRTSMIPIGNYINIYENKLSQKEARRRLGINQSYFVFGMIGKIEAYKGVIELIRVFIECELENAFLLIVGKCPDVNLEREIKKLVKNKKNIRLELSFVQDEAIQLYMNSFDVLVYPFTNITTSSSILLAMSFSKATICPRIADIKDFNQNTGFYYDENKPSELQFYMKQAFQNREKTRKKGEAAFKYISKIEWKESSRMTYELYRKLV